MQITSDVWKHQITSGAMGKTKLPPALGKIKLPSTPPLADVGARHTHLIYLDVATWYIPLCRQPGIPLQFE